MPERMITPEDVSEAVMLAVRVGSFPLSESLCLVLYEFLHEGSYEREHILRQRKDISCQSNLVPVEFSTEY
jgi:hypothetical protein